MKKKMYYNMRIKTMKRSFSTLNKLIKKAKKIKIDSLTEDIQNLQLKISSQQCNEEQLKDLKIYLSEKYEELNYLDKIHNSMKRKIFETSNHSINRLITELETGGNIRLEEGKPADKWFMSCVDLIKSRFNCEEMQQFGIDDIDIRRVIRIHNRFLRNKFEEKMESLVDVSNTNYKKSLEYLFFGLDPNSP